jgi:hypothetical protein
MCGGGRVAKKRDDGFVLRTYMPAVYDLETGEQRPMTEEEYKESRKPVRRARLADEDGAIAPKSNSLFFRVYKTNWYDLVQNSGLTMAQLGLFVSLMALADWGTNRLVHPETRMPLSMRALSQLLNIDRKHLIAVVGVLEEKGLIAVREMGNITYLLVNAHVMYFGKFMSNMDEHRQAFVEGKYTPVVPVAYRPPEKN